MTDLETEGPSGFCSYPVLGGGFLGMGEAGAEGACGRDLGEQSGQQPRQALEGELRVREEGRPAVSRKASDQTVK